MLRPSLIRASSSTAAVTIRQYKGEDHLVVPFVVMVGDSVVRPMGSEGPEFISSEVLSFAPEIWNGTNVILDHPNGAATACDPATLEATQFGTAFNSRFENGALQIDLWLSPSRAEIVGPEAVSIINKCKQNQKVEVSFAPYMVVEEEKGTSPNNVPYDYRVVAIVGADHIAALPEGVVGACSISMGCGGPSIMKGMQSMGDQTSFYKRMIAAFSSLLRPNADVGDLDLWVRIAESLRASEVGFQNLEEIFHDSDTTGRIIYSTGNWESSSLWQRGFTISEEGVIKLEADRTEVRKDSATYSPVMEVESPTAEILVAASDGDNHQCSCNQSPRKELVHMSDKKKGFVAKLMACGRFKQAVLEAMTEEVLESLAGAVDAEASAAASGALSTIATADPVTGALTPVMISRDQALAAIGITEDQLAAMQTAAIAHQAQLNAHKAQLITDLAAAQANFTAADLQAMSVETLEKLTRTLQTASGRADFSFSNVGVRPNSSEKKYTPPDPHGVNKYIYPDN